MTISTQSLSQKHIYAVLGMARSGTSVITRGLQAVGVDLGDQLYRPDHRNPKGFYEDVDIVYKLNRSILYHLDYPMLPNVVAAEIQNGNKLLAQYKQRAIKLLEQRFVNTNHWGFKDPRNIVLLPFWQDVFAELSLNQHYVIALRNPLASAQSVQKLSKKELEQGLLAWLLHLYSAVELTQGHQAIVIAYEAMLKQPKTQLERLKDKLCVHTAWDNAAVKEYENNFLDKHLQHYHFSDAELTIHPAMKVLPLCIDLYRLLQQLASDELSFDSSRFQSQWADVQMKYREHYPVYEYLLKLLKELKLMERKLRTVRKSVPWKLLYPLRLIDDTLRTWRKRVRDQRKLANAQGQ